MTTALTDKLLSPQKPEHPLQPVLDQSQGEGEIIPSSHYFAVTSFELHEKSQPRSRSRSSSHSRSNDHGNKASDIVDKKDLHEEQEAEQELDEEHEEVQDHEGMLPLLLMTSPTTFLSHPTSLYMESDDIVQRCITRHGAIPIIKELSRLLAEKEAELDKLKETLIRKTTNKETDSSTAIKDHVDQDSDLDQDRVSINVTTKVFAADAMSLRSEMEEQTIHNDIKAALTEDVFYSSNSKLKTVPIPVRVRTDSNDSKTSSVSDWMPVWFTWKRQRPTSTSTIPPSVMRSSMQSTLLNNNNTKETGPSKSTTANMQSNSLLEEGAIMVDSPEIQQSSFFPPTKAFTPLQETKFTAFNFPESKSSLKSHLTTGSLSRRTNVQLEAIIAPESQPPTYRIKSDKVLTDRYGFLYDSQSSRRRLRSAADAAGIKHLNGIDDNDRDRGRDKDRDKDKDKDGKSNTENIEHDVVEDVTSFSSAAVSPMIPGDTDTSTTGFVPSPALPSDGETSSLKTAPTSTFTILTATNTQDTSTSPLSPTSSSSSISSKSTSSSIKKLLSQLMVAHDSAQITQKERWDRFLETRRAAMKADRRRILLESSNKREEESQSELVSAARMLAHARQDTEPFDDDDSEDFGLWNNEGLIGIMSMKDKEEWKEFRNLVRDGVPVIYRPKIWTECSGALELKEPGYYVGLLLKHSNETSICLSQIEVDVRRTMPNNIFFGGNGPGVEKLRRVLVAYSWHNPTVGYCQGMNMLAATLLLTHATEEDAFWVLVCIIERILPSDYYTSQLLVSQADQRVLAQLTKEYLPKVFTHLNNHGVNLAAITFPWFLSIFTDCLPVETVLRVWDVFFVEGMSVLFRVSIAILKMAEKDIRKCDSASELYRQLKLTTSHMYQVDRLMQVACDTLAQVIKPNHILKAREAFVKVVKKELGQMDNDNNDNDKDDLMLVESED